MAHKNANWIPKLEKVIFIQIIIKNWNSKSTQSRNYFVQSFCYHPYLRRDKVEKILKGEFVPKMEISQKIIHYPFSHEEIKIIESFLDENGELKRDIEIWK